MLTYVRSIMTFGLAAFLAVPAFAVDFTATNRAPNGRFYINWK
jgi:hypothetical protein